MGFGGSFSRGFFHGGGAHMTNSATGQDYYASDGSVAFGAGDAIARGGLAVRNAETAILDRGKDVLDTAENILDPDNWLMYGAIVLGVYVFVNTNKK